MWGTSIVFGYCYGDVPELSMNALVAADSEATAAGIAAELVADCWASRHDFAPRLLTPEQAVADLPRGDGLTALVDTGDNVGGAAAGTSTALVKALLEADGLRAAPRWPPPRRCRRRARSAPAARASSAWASPSSPCARGCVASVTAATSTAARWSPV